MEFIEIQDKEFHLLILFILCLLIRFAIKSAKPLLMFVFTTEILFEQELSKY